MMVRLEGIHKSFAAGFLMKRREVLKGLDLQVQAGDTYALLGANGAGKSTTIRILLGLSTPNAGRGSMLGQPLGTLSVRRRLGYLPENPTFHEQLTPAEFLAYSGQLLGMRRSEWQARSEQLLERVGLTEARNRRLRKLSKGMCQRLGLAQVLLGDPELLILDEPMSGLDPPGRKMVRDLILEQRNAGKTVLFSTHILSDAEVVCTRAGILRDGRLLRELDIEDVTSLNSGAVEVRVQGLSEDHLTTLDRRGLAVTQHGASVMITTQGGEPTNELIRTLVEWGGEILSVVRRHASLEEIYMASQAQVSSPAQPSMGSPEQVASVQEAR